MSEQQEPSSLRSELETQPFFYEIHVKGRLSPEKWTSWFDNLTITAEKGESTLRGTLPDHAALYGLIGRLRDLAVPLLSVNVLDAEAELKLRKKNRRYNLMLNLLLMLVYLFMLGGLIALTVFITTVIPVALTLTLLFAVLGGLSYAFFIWDKGRFWQYLAYLLWLAAVITFFIYLAAEDVVHPALSIATLLFLGAGGVIYLIYYVRGRSQEVNNLLVEWETLSQTSEADEINELKEAAKRDLNQ